MQAATSSREDELPLDPDLRMRQRDQCLVRRRSRTQRPTETITPMPPESERETIIEICAHFARTLMLPRSVGQVYGILFASEEAMCLDSIQGELGISRGATSQGLQLLRELGAVRIERREGDRRDYYSPEVSLRKILQGVFRNRIQPDLEKGRDMIASLADAEIDTPLLKKRVASLQQWSRRADLPLNIASKFI